MFQNQPLPYIVKIRMGAEDEIPIRSEHRVTAYNAMEAVMQVIITTGGTGISDEKIKIESIEPDVPAFLKLVFAHGK